MMAHFSPAVLMMVSLSSSRAMAVVRRFTDSKPRHL
jgi:hypothetical protein